MGNPFASSFIQNLIEIEASHTPTLAVVVFMRRFFKRLAGASYGAILIAGFARATSIVTCHLSLVT